MVEIPTGNDLLNLLHSKVEIQKPKLILLDMNMPRKNGLEVLSSIRSNQHSAHIPVVMITTSSSQQLIGNAYKQGINAFLTKPFSVNDYANMAEAINVCFFNGDPLFRTYRTNSRNFRNKSILVIEDDANHLNAISTALKKSTPDAESREAE